MTRENILSKIAQLKEELSIGGRSTFSQDMIERNIRGLQRDLEILDTHGDLAMVQQMTFENGINQA